MASVKAQMSELASLIGDLQELSRPDAVREGPLEVVGLHDITRIALDRARLRGPELTITAQLAPWYVRAEPAALQRAVVNVLDNAVKFSPPRGTITVALDRGVLTVRDQGPGIPAEDLPHVFERFWRSPSARALPGLGPRPVDRGPYGAARGRRGHAAPAPAAAPWPRSPCRAPDTPAGSPVRALRAPVLKHRPRQGRDRASNRHDPRPTSEPTRGAGNCAPSPHRTRGQTPGTECRNGRGAAGPADPLARHRPGVDHHGRGSEVTPSARHPAVPSYT